MSSSMTSDRTSDETVRNTNDKIVLVVDDNPVDRRIAGAIIAKVPGLSVVAASDGEEALRLIERDRPAAVLTDLQMPGLDGFGLVEAIRKNHPEVPVILMTAHGSEEVAMRALRAGAASYVPKRSLAGDLASTLQHVLTFAATGRKRQRLLGAMRARSSIFELENDVQLISPLVELLQEDLAAMGLDDGTAGTRVGMALHEALTNALYHGNLEVSSDLRQEDESHFHDEAKRRLESEPYRSRSIHVEARLDREAATYVIRDDGPGFDVSILDRPVDPESLMRHRRPGPAADPDLHGRGRPTTTPGTRSRSSPVGRPPTSPPADAWCRANCRYSFRPAPSKTCA